MRPNLLELLLRGDRLGAMFQPIFEIKDGHASTCMLECLTRGPVGTNMASAGVLFEYVRRKGRENVIDRLCMTSLFGAASLLPDRPVLSVNVHAATFQRDPSFPQFLLEEAARHGIASSRLVLEIVEHAPSYGGPRFLEALRDLRLQGLRFALDDIGLGQSNYRMILDCDPEYLKVDSFLVQGCHRDARRMAILDSLVHLSRRFGSRVVAEGVEEQGDLDAVTSIGIELVQGFLLARPAPAEAFAKALATGPQGRVFA
jgi:EAL domain-containing protein (putative c-di-GMP-specific phosphodiesterase class I)